MTNRFFVTTVCLSIIVIAESLWSVNYLSAAQRQEATVKNSLTGPKLALSTASNKLTVGEEFKVDIVVKPQTKAIQAVDAVILFDKDSLSATQVSPSVELTAAEYPQLRFDNNEGKIAVSLVLPQQSISQPTTIAQIVFQTKTAGQVKIWFDFEPGKTTDSNVVLEGDAQDSLAGVENLNVDITNQ